MPPDSKVPDDHDSAEPGANKKRLPGKKQKAPSKRTPRGRVGGGRSVPDNRLVRLLPKKLRSPLLRCSAVVDRVLDRLAATDRRRARSALALALALNLVFLTLLVVFGRVRIYVPNAPASSISITLVNLPVDPLIPELRDPEITPEPEPEPEEIEIVEEPEPELEPEPEPIPEPAPEEPEPEPEPELKPELEPEPVIDFMPEPEFAPPGEEENFPFIPDPTLLDNPEPLAPSVEEAAPGDILVEGEQTPVEDAPPLVTVEPQAPGEEGQNYASEDDDEEEEDIGELTVGEDRAGEEPPIEEITEEPPPAGDDMFDEEPVFAGSRFALPAVDLPIGETASIPGSSGVIAIFCPDQFENEDKQKECAGRPEIRSGWLPGASGEDWTEAIRLLREARRQGRDGVDPALIFGPEIARRLEDELRARDLEDFRRSADDLNEPFQKDTLTGGADRPDIGPAPFEPSWTKREDPDFDQGDLEKLREALDEAERKKSE